MFGFCDDDVQVWEAQAKRRHETGEVRRVCVVCLCGVADWVAAGSAWKAREKREGERKIKKDFVCGGGTCSVCASGSGCRSGSAG